jgi:hypothetical protein
MHVILPKIRKSDGKLVVTSVLASQINGLEERPILVNGTKVQGCKIYGPYGHFYVPLHPMIIMQGQALAMGQGQPVMISKSGGVEQLSYGNAQHQALMSKAQPEMLPVGQKKISSGTKKYYKSHSL